MKIHLKFVCGSILKKMKVKIKSFVTESLEWRSYRLKKEINELDFPFLHHNHFFIGTHGRIFALENLHGEVCAIVEIFPSNYEMKTFNLNHIIVKESERNKGHAKEIMFKVFKFLTDIDCDLRVSPYTHEGFDYLRPILYRYGSCFGVQVKESGMIDFPETKAQKIFDQEAKFQLNKIA